MTRPPCRPASALINGHRLRFVALTALALTSAVPAQAAVEILAYSAAPARLVFDGLNGYTGSLGASASVPVSLYYTSNRPGAAPERANTVGTLDMSFTVSPSAQRNFYPFVDPFVKQIGAREGASWSGTFDTMSIRLTIPNDGDPLTLLALTMTAPVARFTLDDFVTYRTDGRGLKWEHRFGGSKRHEGRIQAGRCHRRDCTMSTPEAFTLESDVLQLDQTIPSRGYRGMVLILGDADSGFTGSADAPFTVPFSLAFLSAVPEPGSWVLMITGFGLIGNVLRRQRIQGTAE